MGKNIPEKYKNIFNKYNEKNRKIIEKNIYINSIFNNVYENVYDDDRLIDMRWDMNGQLIIENKQHIEIDFDSLSRSVQSYIGFLGLLNFDLKIILVNDSYISKLNNNHRNIPSATDILAWRVYPNITPGGLSRPKRLKEFLLGELVISVQFVQLAIKMDCELAIEIEQDSTDEQYITDNDRGVHREQLKTFDLQKRIELVCLHGILHLIGYNDSNREEWSEMVEMEEEILKNFENKEEIKKRSIICQIPEMGFKPVGVGTDIVKLSRFDKLMIENQSDRMAVKILSPVELTEYHQLYVDYPELSLWRRRAAKFMAQKFAFKEAVSKAFGVGLSYISLGGLKMRDIQIDRNKNGQPVIKLLGKREKIDESAIGLKLMGSYSDDGQYGIAFVTVYAVI
eukprot:GHVL01007290.1.p1 GENE.GHVL01007290.1~~GHVL01007290.1.p1  ORF type:complete len:397 (-),score=85.16 GHVL01007290.1:104-1294(-)